MTGKIIKYMRNKKNLTKEDIEQKLNLKKGTLEKYENGEKIIPFKIFEEIIELCNFKLEIIDKETKEILTTKK